MQRLILLLAACFFLFILWVIYLANTDSQSIFFDFVDSIPYGDKLGHFCLFGLLTFLAVLVLKFRTLPMGKRQIYLGTVLVTTFVVLEEISQAFIASRTFDLTDLTADFVGITMASLLAYCIKQYSRPALH